MDQKRTYKELEDRIKELEKIVDECRLCEEALAEKEKAYRTLQENVPIGLFRFDTTGRLLSSNPAALKMFGYDVDDDLTGKHIQNFFKAPETGLATLNLVIGTGGVKDLEFELKRKDGSFFWGATSSILIRDPDGGHDFIDGFVLDITDRKRAENLLAKEKAFSEAIINGMPGVFYVYDENRRLIRWNKNHEIVTGSTAEETIGKAPRDWFKAEHQQTASDAVDRAFADGYAEAEIPFGKKDGTIVPYKFNGNRLVTDDGSYMLGLGLDISDLKKVHEDLKHSERLLADIIEFLPDATYVIDVQGRVVVWNRAIEELSGVKKQEIVGKGNYEYALPFYGVRRPVLIDLTLKWDDEIARLYSNLTCRGDILFSETVNPPFRSEPSLFWNSASLLYNAQDEVFGAIEVIRDITYRMLAEQERRSLEVQLIQVQKMEAIGTLAGGIAHDFNNILSAILGYTELSKLALDEKDQLSDFLNNILKAGGRAKDLIKQILTFSRQTEFERQPVSVKLLMKEALKLLRASLPSSIEINQNIKSEALVMADPTQIHQIIMNLCTNAGHAMQETGGTLTVELSDIEIDNTVPHESSELKTGKYLQFSVSDTGVGMSPEVLAQIYDPFFTTKKREEGTGLGLAVVHGIVKNIEGRIYARSQPGKGSMLNVLLPVFKGISESSKEIEEALPRGNGQILFVDDEHEIIDIGKKMLESLGYEVVTRTSSIDALELFRASPNSFDLVVTDLTMPQMTGDRLAAELISIRKDIPIILCTGFGNQLSEENAKSIGIKSLLMKPILRAELARSIKNIIDDAQNESSQ